MNNFGLGLIGATLEGGFLLAPLIVDTVEKTGLRLRAIYDADEHNAREAQLVIESKYAQINIPQDIYLTSEFQHMFDDFMLDIMLIASPAAEHRTMVEGALADFDRIALQTPIALNLEDAQAIVEASNHSPILVNLPRRFEAGWQKAHELLQSGVIGDLQFINLRTFLPETNYLRLWQRTQTGRDDLFLGQLCNYMDVFNWFAGAPCVQISGIGDEREHDLDDYDPNGIYKQLFHQLPVSWRSLVSAHVEGVDVDDFPADHYLDHAAVQLLFSNNMIGSLMIASHGPAAQDTEDLELVGDKGRIWFNAQEGKLYLHFWDGSQSERIENLGETELPLFTRLNAAFLQQMPAFIEGFLPAASAVEGAEALKLALAALESIQNNGQPILIDLPLEGETLPEIVEEESHPEMIEEVEIMVEEVLIEETAEETVDAVHSAVLETDDDWDDEHPAVETIVEAEEPVYEALEEEAQPESEMTDWPEPLDSVDEDKDAQEEEE